MSDSPPTGARFVLKDGESQPTVLEVIRRRRVVRHYLPESLDEDTLLTIVDAANHAPSGDNLRQLRFVLVQSPQQLRRVITVSPGIFAAPAAIVAICVDWERTPYLTLNDPRDTPTYIDVGAAMENALLAAESFDIGACPVTSFHRPSVRTILDLPAMWTPYVLITLGRRMGSARTQSSRRLDGVLFHDRYVSKQ